MRGLNDLERAILSDADYRASTPDEHAAFDRLVDRGCLRYSPCTDDDPVSVWADITAAGALALRLDAVARAPMGVAP